MRESTSCTPSLLLQDTAVVMADDVCLCYGLSLTDMSRVADLTQSRSQSFILLNYYHLNQRCPPGSYFGKAEEWLYGSEKPAQPKMTFSFLMIHIVLSGALDGNRNVRHSQERCVVSAAKSQESLKQLMQRCLVLTSFAKLGSGVEVTHYIHSCYWNKVIFCVLVAYFFE